MKPTVGLQVPESWGKTRFMCSSLEVCYRKTCPSITLYFLCEVTTRMHGSNYNETGSAKTLNRTSLLYYFL